jgi:hypothetical protein
MGRACSMHCGDVYKQSFGGKVRRKRQLGRPGGKIILK